ncbi:MAG: minor capsid protein [Desulfarculales bacterium]|jgi:SPP1 gp7 family putative phage head morphogenesis protein|nr:minor capsid protein [Desulfarculales bacterium]
MADSNSNPAIQAYDQPFQEALEFWQSKTQITPGQYRQLSDEAKLKAFAVAGIAREDELAGVYQALQAAIEKGITLEDFKAQCADIFTRRGWSGKASWRIDNIFRTNLQTAYSVGHYKQMTESAENRPYAMYLAIMDDRTRPTHAALHGKVFPLNHEFWDTWWPPNGFFCRCTTVSLSQRQVDKRGLTVEADNPNGHLIEPVDPQTKQNLPARPLIPDRGFAYHPGKTMWGASSDEIPVFKDMPNLKGPADYRRPALHNVPASSLPLLDKARLLLAGQSDNFYLSEFLKLYGQNKIIKDAAGQAVILSPRIYEIVKGSNPPIYKFPKAGHGVIIPLLEEMIQNPYEIWITPAKDEKSGLVRLVRRYISLWKTNDKQRIPGIAVFEVVRGELQGVSVFAPGGTKKPNLAYVENQRHGLLIHKN